MMALMAIHPANDRRGLLIAAAIFSPIGVALITPVKQFVERAPTTS
jgi:hypothetical protein